MQAVGDVLEDVGGEMVVARVFKVGEFLVGLFYLLVCCAIDGDYSSPVVGEKEQDSEEGE